MGLSSKLAGYKPSNHAATGGPTTQQPAAQGHGVYQSGMHSQQQGGHSQIGSAPQQGQGYESFYPQSFSAAGPQTSGFPSIQGGHGSAHHPLTDVSDSLKARHVFNHAFAGQSQRKLFCVAMPVDSSLSLVGCHSDRNTWYLEYCQVIDAG